MKKGKKSISLYGTLPDPEELVEPKMPPVNTSYRM